MIFEICAIIITLIIVVLAYFIIDLIRKLKISLRRFNKLALKLEDKLEPMSNETIKILENTNEITDALNSHVNSLNPVFNSIANLGTRLDTATENLAETPRFSRHSKKSHWQENISDLAELAALGLILWQKIKERR